MKLTYLGHASFLADLPDGRKIIFDPYEPGAFDGKIAYGPYKGKVDILVSTHDHKDHFYVSPDFGNPVIVRDTMDVGDIHFEGIKVPHDPEGGKIRGWVTAFKVEYMGLSVVHLGDIGIVPDDELVGKFGDIHILMIPVGGTFTIGPKEAVETVKRLKPYIVIPMHYKTPKVGFDLEPLDSFLNIAPWPVEKLGKKSLVAEQVTPPAETTVIVMDPVL